MDTKQKAWALWEDKLRSGWRYNPKYVQDEIVYGLFRVMNIYSQHLKVPGSMVFSVLRQNRISTDYAVLKAVEKERKGKELYLSV